MGEHHDEQIDGHKEIIATAQRTIAELQEAKQNAAGNLALAKGRDDRLRKGEDVSGGLGRPRTQEEWAAIMGLSERDLRRYAAVAELCQQEGGQKALSDEINRECDRSREATIFRMGEGLHAAVAFVGCTEPAVVLRGGGGQRRITLLRSAVDGRNGRWAMPGR